MKFVSCLPVSDTSNTQEDVDEVVLCESHFLQESFPSSAEALEDLCIEWLVLSEGSEIHQRHNCRLENIHVYSDVDKTKYVWYELVRQLSGHKIYYREFDRKIKFTRWICHAPEDGKWSIFMELMSGGMVRTIAQLDLIPASHCELNLFRMANELYQDCCNSNDKIISIGIERDLLKTRIKDLQEERKILDKLLEQRDVKTRSIVIGLLNEKKNKIVELQEKLNNQGPQDSDIINRHIEVPIKEHISTNTKNRCIDSGGNNRKKQKIPKKLQIKEEEPGLETEPDNVSTQERKPDFRFWGIQKLGHSVKQEDDTEPQEIFTSSTESSASHTEVSADEDDSEKNTHVKDNDDTEEEEETDVEA